MNLEFTKIILILFIIIILIICQGGYAYEIIGENYKINILENPWKISIYNREGNLIVEEAELEDSSQQPLSYFNKGWQSIKGIEKITNNEDKYTFFCRTTDGSLTKVAIGIEKNKINISFYAPKIATIVKEVLTSGAKYNSHYYGFGERFNSLDQRGSTIEMWNIDQPKTFGTSSYVNVPFFFEIVNEGGVLPGSTLESTKSYHTYGFYLKNNSKSTFKMSSDLRRAYSISTNDNKLEYVLFIEDSPLKVLKSYTKLTGFSELPPKWAFAPWKSRDNYYSVNDVLEDVNMMRQLDIPMSVLVLDSPWETSYNDFNFNEVQFPNYQNMINYLHQKGNKLILWITPFTNSISNVEVNGQKERADNFDYADKSGYFVKDEVGNTMLIDWWKGTGGAVDFTNNEAINWWQENIAKLINIGVDGFKTDDGEYIPYNAVFSNGLTGKDMHNIYSLLYNKATYEILKKVKNEAIVFARSGWAGSQKYPAIWSGDQEGSFNYRDGLPATIIAGLSAAMSGFSFWSHDIGGYRTPVEKEVFIRWAEFGCFTPIMQIHGQNREPWKFDDETVSIYRKFAKLHTTLFPYIYSFAKISSEEGTPIMRPLVLAYPNDEKVYNEDFEYLFGDSLLVAPMYQRGTERQVYLPEGIWYDFWNNEEYHGPKYTVYEAPLNIIPLFVKKGAIIPQLDEKIDSLIEKNSDVDASIATLSDVSNELFLTVYPNKNEQFKLYDGTIFTVYNNENNLKLNINKVKGSKIYNFKIFSSHKPRKVKVNNKLLHYNPIHTVKLLKERNVYFYNTSKKFVTFASPINKDTIIEIKY
jgi:alpha-D-xyloside xylohydrolase